MTSAVSTARVTEEERSILVSFNPKLSPFAAYRSRCAILFGEDVHAVLGALDEVDVVLQGLASVPVQPGPQFFSRFQTPPPPDDPEGQGSLPSEMASQSPLRHAAPPSAHFCACAELPNSSEESPMAESPGS